MELSLKDLKELFCAKNEEHPFKIGEPYFIRTVTMHYSGRLKAVYDKELVLTDCAWIPDDGRFSECFTKEFNEVEPFPDGDVIIGRGSILDAAILRKDLPRKQK